MIVIENIEINGKQFTRTYSASGYYILRNGVKYEDAIDLPDSGRVYTETEESYLPEDATEVEYLLALERLGVEV